MRSVFVFPACVLCLFFLFHFLVYCTIGVVQVIILISLCEFSGNGKLVIPPNRDEAAYWEQMYATAVKVACPPYLSLLCFVIRLKGHINFSRTKIKETYQLFENKDKRNV